MTETRLLDYAFQHPTPAAVKKSGAIGVMRYLTHSGPPKRVTAAEITALHAAGLDVGFVFEDSAGRAAGSRADGAADALAAYQQLTGLKAPAGTVVFFAVDFDTTPQHVTDYFRGVASVHGSYQPGVYGSLRVVDGILTAGLVKWGWQTVAWSGGALSSHAHLYQRNHSKQPVPGTDENVLLKPFPRWAAHAAPVPAPHPAPAPTPKPPTPPPPALPVKATRRLVQFHDLSAVYEVIGSHLEHVTGPAFAARGLTWDDVDRIPADHPLSKLPRTDGGA